MFGEISVLNGGENDINMTLTFWWAHSHTTGIKERMNQQEKCDEVREKLNYLPMRFLPHLHLTQTSYI